MNTITIIAATFLTVGLLVAISRGIQWIVDFFFAPILVQANSVALHYRDGKNLGLVQPGRYRFYGFRHTFQHFDTRRQQFTLQVQELNTVEGITVKATAVGFYKILDPIKLTESSDNYSTAIYTHVQLALRDLMSGIKAETLLSNTAELGPTLLASISKATNDIGIEFTQLTVRDLILPTEIKNALSEAWRAKKHSLAELEAARGKAAATRTLANSAKLYQTNPALLQVRYLEALETAAEGMGHTFVIGMSEDKALTFKK